MTQAFFDGKRATRLKQARSYEVVKMRFDCSAPGAQGKLRLAFVFLKTATSIQFLELYSKNDKPREDAGRIEQYTVGL
jgi:hypothetical protein